MTPVSQDEIGVVTVSRQAGRRGASLAAEFPELGRRLAGARPITAERGAITLMQKLEAVYRGNVALLGDASAALMRSRARGFASAFARR